MTKKPVKYEEEDSPVNVRAWSNGPNQRKQVNKSFELNPFDMKNEDKYKNILVLKSQEHNNCESKYVSETRRSIQELRNS
eukprot:CAMPEP_0170554564 /NCGR_PEP_ID=MMETSP0211-20121228/12416_1 /TAXON_ID=311385 /ORGANISM="Pseudokeronopsis sp., Strain OXSARD2" /LENGTH=79 /DNA_ID=CAMNT_0010863717 /DNA_START=505 /DNA_END=744 /DNA_ORIENTATION=+